MAEGVSRWTCTVNQCPLRRCPLLQHPVMATVRIFPTKMDRKIRGHGNGCGQPSSACKLCWRVCAERIRTGRFAAGTRSASQPFTSGGNSSWRVGKRFWPVQARQASNGLRKRTGSCGKCSSICRSPTIGFNPTARRQASDQATPHGRNLPSVGQGNPRRIRVARQRLHPTALRNLFPEQKTARGLIECDLTMICERN